MEEKNKNIAAGIGFVGLLAAAIYLMSRQSKSITPPPSGCQTDAECRPGYKCVNGQCLAQPEDATINVTVTVGNTPTVAKVEALYQGGIVDSGMTDADGKITLVIPAFDPITQQPFLPTSIEIAVLGNNTVPQILSRNYQVNFGDTIDVPIVFSSYSTPQPQCQSDSDCASGQVCQNQACVTPSAPTVPSAPRNLAWTKINNMASLEWEEPINDGGVNILGYNVLQYSSAGGGTPINRIDVGQTRTVRPTTIANHHYYFAVVAINAIGESAPSNIVDVYYT